MSAEADTWAVLSFYALDRQTVRQVEPIGSGGGWSGSRLWRVTDAAGRRFCLRRWPPEHPSPERLRFIHAVLGRVAQALPAIAQPLPAIDHSSYVEHCGTFWELAGWKPGAADDHVPPTAARLRAALSALAEFHTLAEKFEARVGSPPTLSDRCRQCGDLVQGGLVAIEQAIQTPLGNAIDARSRPMLTLARQTVEQLQHSCETAIPTQRLLVPAIRDIHRDHVLFTGDEVTGIIDFGAMRIDTPLADVARLVGSLAAHDRVAREIALAAYSALRPLSEADRRLVDLLDDSGLVLGALNWLTWLYVERRDMGEVAPIVRRLDAISARLARLPVER